MRIGLGVIGCGNIAYWSHLRVAGKLDGATLVAASDPDEAARKRAKGLTGITPHADTAALLERDDVDAVIISGPTHLHADLAVAACAAGKHTYLEKPIATTVADGRRVKAAGENAGVTLMMGFNRRFHPAFEQARDLLSSGRLGRVRAIQSTFCEPSPVHSMPVWKRKRETGGGVLLDLASHHIDLIRWFLGGEVLRVSAAVTSDASEHDSARLELTMNTGTEVQGWFSFRSGLSDWFEFACEAGTLRIDRHHPRISLRVPRRMGYGVRNGHVASTAAVRRWRLERMIRPSVEPSYSRSLHAFVRAVQGQENGIPDFDDGLRALEVVEAAESSAESGVPVEVRRA